MATKSIRALLMGIAAVGVLASGHADAQTPDQSFYFNGRPYDPFDYYFDGPPEVAGCARQCARDFSPCDTPLEKKTDGRCNRNF